LNAITAGSPLSLETSKGELSITSFTDNGDGTYDVAYTYTLTEAAVHPAEGADPVDKEPIVVSAEDALAQTSEDASLNVSIIDDVPIGVTQNGIAQNDVGTLLVGDLVEFGADGGLSVEFKGVTGGDLFSNGVKLVYDIDGDTVTASAGE